MATLLHQVWINAPLSKVYDSVATAEGLGTWWRRTHRPRRRMASCWRTTRAENMAK